MSLYGALTDVFLSIIKLILLILRAWQICANIMHYLVSITNQQYINSELGLSDSWQT